ncbi:unnamed protein product, partial [Ectocarpus sp. 8 AP-2014]
KRRGTGSRSTRLPAVGELRRSTTLPPLTRPLRRLPPQALPRARRRRRRRRRWCSHSSPSSSG